MAEKARERAFLRMLEHAAAAGGNGKTERKRVFTRQGSAAPPSALLCMVWSWQGRKFPLPALAHRHCKHNFFSLCVQPLVPFSCRWSSVHRTGDCKSIGHRMKNWKKRGNTSEQNINDIDFGFFVLVSALLGPRVSVEPGGPCWQNFLRARAFWTRGNDTTKTLTNLENANKPFCYCSVPLVH